MGGEESVYGWLKDKFGLSRRIVPKILGDILKDRDEEKIEAVTATFLQMKKLEIEPLRWAFEPSEPFITPRRPVVAIWSPETTPKGLD